MTRWLRILMAVLGFVGGLGPFEAEGEAMAFSEALMVVHLCGTRATRIAPAPADTGQDLPPTLVIPPGTYRFRGKSFDLRADGLYGFLLPPKETQQPIVRRPDGDPLAFVSAVCWLHSHGYREDDAPYDALMYQAQTGKLIMTCGPYSNFYTMPTEAGRVEVERVWAGIGLKYLPMVEFQARFYPDTKRP